MSHPKGSKNTVQIGLPLKWSHGHSADSSKPKPEDDAGASVGTSHEDAHKRVLWRRNQDASREEAIQLTSMASLTRRNVNTGNGEVKQRSNSMWEQEADHYWKEMEPAKRYKKISGYVGMVILGLLVISGAAWSAKSVWNNGSLASMAMLKDRFFPMAAANISTATEPTTAPAANTNQVSSTTSHAHGNAPAATPRTSDPAAVDLLRARCRVRGVQTRWHEETCRKLCIRDPQNTACMNGCSYGSITITKATCDHLDVASIPTSQQCPDGVNCVNACKAYENEAPVPATRVSCERACTNIVASSCSRILQIYRDLYKGSM